MHCRVLNRGVWFVQVRDRDHLVSSEVLNQSLPVVLALITNPNSQAAQSSMSNIVRLSSDLRGQAVVGTVQCRGNGQRRQLCIDVLGRQDNRPHPAIVVCVGLQHLSVGSTRYIDEMMIVLKADHAPLLIDFLLASGLANYAAQS